MPQLQQPFHVFQSGIQQLEEVKKFSSQRIVLVQFCWLALAHVCLLMQPWQFLSMHHGDSKS
jgi:hypothetical protein